MAKMGAPLGNQNASKKKICRLSLLRSLARADTATRDPEKTMDRVMDKVVWFLLNAEVTHPDFKWALDYVSDRTEGKPKTAIVGGDEDDEPVKVSGVVELVRPG